MIATQKFDISLLFPRIVVYHMWCILRMYWVLPSNGRRLALFSEGDQKPSVYIEICSCRNLCSGGNAIMTDYEIIALVVAILGLLVSLLGIIVKLIIELINAKK